MEAVFRYVSYLFRSDWSVVHVDLLQMERQNQVRIREANTNDVSAVLVAIIRYKVGDNWDLQQRTSSVEKRTSYPLRIVYRHTRSSNYSLVTLVMLLPGVLLAVIMCCDLGCTGFGQGVHHTLDQPLWSEFNGHYV